MVDSPKSSMKCTHDESSLLCSSRLWLAFTGLLGFVFLYSQRVGMSVAIVCMVNHTAIEMQKGGAGGAHFPPSVNQSVTPDNSSVLHVSESGCLLTSSKGDTEDGSLVWEKSVQGHILGAFFYGYLLSQIPAGLLAERFGGKWVFAAFFLLSTLGTLLTPALAPMGPAYVIVARVIVGIGSGGIFPSMHTIWGQWAPPMERSKLAGITYAGMMLGNVVALPVSGMLCQYGFGSGWESVFYVFGGLSATWLAFWVLLAADSPAKCRTISPEERDYITSSLQEQVPHQKTRVCTLPWFSVLRSPAVWAIIIANITSDWGLYTLLTNIPTYVFEVLKFDMQSNGVISALPFLGMWINMNISPLVADKLRSAHILSTANTRKLMNTIGQLGPACFLLGLTFIDCTQTVAAVALLVCGVTLLGSCYSGFLVNHMDIAPAYAGTLLGLTNCIGAVTGFIAPPVAAALTPNGTRAEWQIVFFVATGMHVIGTIVYGVMAKGELQTWALPHPIESEDVEVKIGREQLLNGHAKFKESSDAEKQYL